MLGVADIATPHSAPYTHLSTTFCYYFIYQQKEMVLNIDTDKGILVCALIKIKCFGNFTPRPKNRGWEKQRSLKNVKYKTPEKWFLIFKIVIKEKISQITMISYFISERNGGKQKLTNRFNCYKWNFAQVRRRLQH